MRIVNPQKVENRKKEILDAARQCFEQKGFHATTMAEICARAQISPGALYRYFPSKEAIIGEMCDEQQFHSLAMLNEQTQKVKSKEDFDKSLDFILDDVCENYCNKEHGAMAAELIAEAMRNDVFAKAAAESYLNIQSQISEFFKIGQKVGAVDKNLDSLEAAAMMMAAVDGLELRIAFCKDLDKSQTLRWLKNIVWRYLRPVVVETNDVKIDTYKPKIISGKK